MTTKPGSRAIALPVTLTALTLLLAGCALPAVEGTAVDNPEHHRGLVNNQKISPDSGQGSGQGGWSAPAN